MSGNSDKPQVDWWIVFRISMACYLPAFLLVLASGLTSYSSFKPTVISSQESGKATLGSQPLTEQQKEQIKEVVKEFSAQRRNDEKIQASFPFAKEYIDGQIKQEAQKQAEQAATDEIEKLKADWKGDLFGQISFPIIFAIASIFAAFAVKDILTEILKDQEKEKIQKELEIKLRNDIVPKIVSTRQKELTDSVREIQVYGSWLEHELLKIITNQVIDELKISLEYGSEEVTKNSLLVIEKLYSRSSLTLNITCNAFEPDQYKYLKKIEHDFFEAKIKSMKFKKIIENNLLSRLSKKIEPPEEQSEYARMEDVFQLQRSLFLNKLYKLWFEESNDSQKSAIENLIKFVKFAPRNAFQEAEKRRKEAEQFNSESTDEINF